MISDPNYKATFVILNDLEAHGLVQFNEEHLDEEFFINFIEFQKAFSNLFSELIVKLDSFQTKRDEMIIFAIYSELSFINSHLEVMKKFLKIIVDPSKIKANFDEKISLTQMIRKICNKMQYSEKLKNSIRGLFLADFETAVSTQQYLISGGGNLIIYPKDKLIRKSLNLNDLYDDAIQVRTIFDAMIDWSNGKPKSANKKNKVLDTVKELIKQVEELDGKLDKLS